ncbi:hypothetical protein [Kribbella sp. NPDC049584]|uniref:hypothetical protein n=1 Tax=Kribbella sp. NPDC049584 TaxID=3154833 RepID=UPI003444E82C
MTSELKDLLDQAVDRPATFTPDVADLVAAGRHRIHVRRAIISAATAATAATVVIAVLLMGHLGNARTAPQPATTTQPTMVTDLCAKSDDFFRTANDDAWRRQVVSKWTDKVVEVTDPDGAMTVRRSPDGSQYAYCVSGVPIQGKALGGFGSTMLNVGIVTRPYQIQQYWSTGCGNDSVDRENRQTWCMGVRYSWAGRVPEGVTRIVVSGLGQHADATIKDGFWVDRVYTDNITKRDRWPIEIYMYDRAGKQVFKQRY